MTDSQFKAVLLFADFIASLSDERFEDMLTFLQAVRERDPSDSTPHPHPSDL